MQTQQVRRLVLRKPDAPRHYLEHEVRRLVECPIEVRQEGSKAGEIGLRQPDVRLLGVIIRAELVAFLLRARPSGRLD